MRINPVAITQINYNCLQQILFVVVFFNTNQR